MPPSHPLPEPVVELIAERFRVMGEPLRIRILDRLRQAETSVGELTGELGATQQNISRHLAVLHAAGIVSRQKEGTKVDLRHHRRFGVRPVRGGVWIAAAVRGRARADPGRHDPQLRDERAGADRPARPFHRRTRTRRWCLRGWSSRSPSGRLHPRVETALSGAGWQANGSQSVKARDIIQQKFGGQSSEAIMVVLHSPTLTATDPAFGATVQRVEQILRADPAISTRRRAPAGRHDLARRPHGRGNGRRGPQPHADGGGGRCSEGQAERCRHHRRHGARHRRLGDVV